MRELSWASDVAGACLGCTCLVQALVVKDDGRGLADDMAEGVVSAEVDEEYASALREASSGDFLHQNEKLVAHTAEVWAEGVMEHLVGSILEYFRKEGRRVLDRVRTKTRNDEYTGKFKQQRMAVFCSDCFRRGFELKKVLAWNLLTMLLS